MIKVFVLFQVTEAGKDYLPPWLQFEPETKTLVGLPSLDDVGQQYYIEVTAINHWHNDTSAQAKDIFGLKVVEDKVHLDSGAVPLKEVKNSGVKPIKCPSGSSVTMASIIVDTNLSNLVLQDKIKLLQGLCAHLQMPTEVVRLLPMGSRPLFDSSALVAGPGDVKVPSTGGSMVEWEVGCGNVYASHMPILQQLESTSHDGSMGRAVGHGIIGWHVTNNKPHSPHRMKRQVNIRPTPTPPPTMGPPTERPGRVTITVDQTDKDGLTRVVPTMASPTFPEIQPTRSHKHHRSKTRGRHHNKTKHPKHSPKHQRTKHPKTVAPTPTVDMIQPTKVTEVTPTMVPGGPIHPTYDVYSSPGVSRSIKVLEPSLMPTDKQGKTSATQVLPTRTFLMPDVITTEPIKPTATAHPPTDMPKPGTTDAHNFEPLLRQDVGRMDMRVGDILDFKIPSETFYDVEDGPTENLKLVLLTMDGLGITHDSWVKFDNINQRLYGIPLPVHVGNYEYSLAAIDKLGKIARNAFMIVVKHRAYDREFNHEFSLTLDLDFARFIVDVDQRMAVSRKIAGLYGDNDMSKMTITGITKGSVMYNWTNNTMPTDTCPVKDIGELLRFLITPDNTLNQTLLDYMHPFVIIKAGAQPRGNCVEGGVPEIESDVKPPIVGEQHPENGVNKEPRDTSEEDVLITTVVPAVVIAAMLLLAGLIACILYRKRRKGKLSDEDQHTFINKGIPIIFQDELEDKPDPPTKPLILANEKPPLPPPEYPRSASGSMPSTPRSDHKEPLIDTTEDEDQPYHRPPPVTGSLGHRQSRARQPQQPYRQPPPYVPP